MPKSTSAFVCQQCGYQTTKWFGQCPSCQAWGSLVETIVREPAKSTSHRQVTSSIEPILLTNIEKTSTKRLSTSIGEFDRVLGGGIVPGMAVLIAGEPGIGKSTLLLELAAKLAGASVRHSGEDGGRRQNLSAKTDPGLSPSSSTNASARMTEGDGVLYVAGEESPQQIKIRADRLGVGGSPITFLPSTDVDQIALSIEQLRPKFVIVDSVQTLTTEDLSSPAGSVGQIRESVDRLTTLAKKTDTPIFLIGHVTKEGSIAGPKILEHIVDTVLVLEGDSAHAFRILRSTKNRFGSTDEVGVFSMEEEGLTEVANASEVFLSERLPDAPGSIIVPTLEGTRAILVEIQALTAPTTLALPRRVGIGVDYNRLQLLLALLSRRFNSKLAQQDVFVNVAGGLKVNEPALDLGICLAIVSSFKAIAIPKLVSCFGEVGLLGEIRSVRFPKQRIAEVTRLGLTNVLCPKNAMQRVQPGKSNGRKQSVIEVQSIQQAIKMVFPADKGA